ncbi:hypothetical protein Tmar_1345 [Thermaerobacter marianensis DSM 12885]|uniref:Uncharacterized protein n=1 Tax=Thermaerobacter marianensis (strain ATCC 700841 / DSM 12885 / JCM 10246 / 7p75a) TaxID=644966 RepID=E6SM99_THEM7|nr:hypothetical protein [Thermaerobacter marianensis]ADU51458.1 hypothetical protein Tmar_1345 [Thermaerobacter marianensis DSM 12885]
MRWLAWTLAGLAAGPAALALYVRRQGDADVRCDAGAVEILEVDRSPGCWRVRFRLPVVNRGRQKGMLYEILVRPEFLGRWAAPLRWSVAFFWPGVQETGYWSATLLKPGQVVPLEVELAAYGPAGALDRLAALNAMGLVVRHGVIGRTPLRWVLTEVRLPLAEAGKAARPAPPAAGSSVTTGTGSPPRRGPVRTVAGRARDGGRGTGAGRPTEPLRRPAAGSGGRV